MFSCGLLASLCLGVFVVNFGSLGSYNIRQRAFLVVVGRAGLGDYDPDQRG